VSDDSGGNFPAFPCQPLNSNGEPRSDLLYGLTKREAFAMAAMQGAMIGVGMEAAKVREEERTEPVNPDEIAIDCIKMADALLKGLAK
jgi:hypothetical protein